MSRKGEYSEFIEGVVIRLATNSIRNQGWAIVLVQVLFVSLVREYQMNVLGRSCCSSCILEN